MNECRRVSAWLEESLWGELPPAARRRLEAHLASCPACRELQRLLAGAVAAAEAGGEEAEREADAVDWAVLNARLLERAGVAKRRTVPWLRRGWPLVASAAAGLLVVAGAAWLWMASGSGEGPAAGVHLSGPALQRIQTALNDGDARRYLQSSRLLLSGVMESCRERPLEAWEAQLYARSARELLRRQRYLDRSAASPADRRVQELNGRLSWLLTEIAALQPGTPCRRLQEIRTLADRENLLLKMRLLEGERGPRGTEEV